MSDTEFTQAVATLRQHQKEFFKSPWGSLAKQEALKQSRLWEKIVDQEVARRQAVEAGLVMQLEGSA